MNRSTWKTYDDLGRAVRRISDQGHRMEVRCPASYKRFGLCAAAVASSYGLIALDYLRESDLDVMGAVAAILALALVLVPTLWVGAMTFWRRIRIDIDRQQISLRARGVLPWGHVAIRPLRDLVGASVGSNGWGLRLRFAFSTGKDWLTPTLWTPPGELDALKDWIAAAAAEMRVERAAMLADRDYERDDERTDLAAATDVTLGPGLAPWPPPPRRVPLWIRARVLLDPWVVLWSVALMILGPLSASVVFGSDLPSPIQFAGPRSRTIALVEACEGTDFRVGGSARQHTFPRPVRRISYRFEAEGASWRSASYIDRRCPPLGARLPVEYPVGHPATSRLRDMYRHPYGPGAGPLWLALLVYALGELAAALVEGVREIRFLGRGRTATATLEQVTPMSGRYGGDFYLFAYRLLVRGRSLLSAHFNDTEPSDGDRAQLVLYDPREPARRRFTGRMRFKNLSAFRGLETNAVAGTLFKALLLAVALLLVVRAIVWTALHRA